VLPVARLGAFAIGFITFTFSLVLDLQLHDYLVELGISDDAVELTDVLVVKRNVLTDNQRQPVDQLVV